VRHNRARILEAAKQVFTRRGAEASMGGIAKRANIGLGTLYRHFAIGDDLLAAVYISEVESWLSLRHYSEVVFPRTFHGPGQGHEGCSRATVEIKQNRVALVPTSDRQPLLNPIDFYQDFFFDAMGGDNLLVGIDVSGHMSRVRVFDDAMVSAPGAEDCSVWANIV
jgi:AcrR family transcriptional regulator